MFKKIFYGLLFFWAGSGLAGASELKNFALQPDYLFTDEDLGVKFTVTVLPQGAEKAKNIILLELNDEGRVKYRWPLNDEGRQGDEKSGDGVYSREIQFKERKPKTIVFYVMEEGEEQKGFASPGETLPAVATQRAELEIRAHPTFIDILGNAWKKIKAKFQ